MKLLLFVLPLLICVLGSCGTKYSYRQLGTETILVDSLRCGEDAQKIYSMELNSHTKFILFEVDNMKQCSVNVMHGLAPLNEQAHTSTVGPEQHFIYIGDISAGGEAKYDFGVDCSSQGGDSKKCTFTFAPYLCDNIRSDKPSDSYVAVQSSRAASIESYTTTDSLCMTPDSNHQELLVVHNDSNTDHEISLTVESTCNCPAFHIEPLGIEVKANESKNEKATVKAKSTMTFIAYCTGEDVVDPGCSGRIRDIQLKPKL